MVFIGVHLKAAATKARGSDVALAVKVAAPVCVSVPRCCGTSSGNPEFNTEGTEARRTQRGDFDFDGLRRSRQAGAGVAGAICSNEVILPGPALSGGYFFERAIKSKRDPSLAMYFLAGESSSRRAFAGRRDEDPGRILSFW